MVAVKTIQKAKVNLDRDVLLELKEVRVINVHVLAVLAVGMFMYWLSVNFILDVTYLFIYLFIYLFYQSSGVTRHTCKSLN